MPCGHMGTSNRPLRAHLPWGRPPSKWACHLHQRKLAIGNSNAPFLELQDGCSVLEHFKDRAMALIASQGFCIVVVLVAVRVPAPSSYCRQGRVLLENRRAWSERSRKWCNRPFRRHACTVLVYRRSPLLPDHQVASYLTGQRPWRSPIPAHRNKSVHQWVVFCGPYCCTSPCPNGLHQAHGPATDTSGRSRPEPAHSERHTRTDAGALVLSRSRSW